MFTLGRHDGTSGCRAAARNEVGTRSIRDESDPAHRPGPAPYTSHMNRKRRLCGQGDPRPHPQEITAK
jgi:hypothetical protein